MRRMLLAVLTVIVINSSANVRTADAGPLLDWLRSRPLFNRSSRVEPVTAYMPPVGTCQTVCPQTCQRVTVSYVPETRYRSNWVQTPITSYRPTTTTDPLTGCQVTCVKPCTTYQWSLRRVPYTTYRPVYQTQTVQMPATTSIGCNTCGIPGATQFGAGAQPVIGSNGAGNYYGQPTYGSVYDPNALSYSGGTSPADMQPTMNGNTTQRIILPPMYDQNGNPIGQSILNQGGESQNGNSNNGNGVDPMNGSQYQSPQGNGRPSINSHSPIIDPVPRSQPNQPVSAPPLLRFDHETAATSLRTSWDYSPIQLAVYQQPVDRIEPNARPVQRASEPNVPQQVPRRTNEGWRTLAR